MDIALIPADAHLRNARVLLGYANEDQIILLFNGVGESGVGQGAGVAISDDILVSLTLMSIGAWLLFAYMVMVRTQILYLTDLLQAKQGRLFSQTPFSQTSP